MARYKDGLLFATSQLLHTLTLTSVARMASYDYTQNSSVSGGTADGMKRFLAIGGLIFFALAIFFAFNFYFKYNQHLTLLNATQGPVTVQIDGGSAMEVDYGMQKVTVSEGRHVVTVTAPFEAEYEIDVTNDFFGRQFSKSVFIVNLGGAGVIEDMDVIYAENPPPPRVTYLCEETMVWHDVDYPFEALPDEVSVDSSSDQVTKTSLQWVDFEKIHPASQFMLMLEMNRSAAFRFACNQIKYNPEDSHELMGIVDAHMEAREYQEVQELMETGLDATPVRIDWHRLYQDIPPVAKDYQQLVKKYDDYLSKSPESAELLYLRGRLDSDPQQQIGYFERAVQADPKLPAPHIALIHIKLAQADWQGALDQIEEAQKHNVPESEYSPLKHHAYLALERAAELIPNYQSRLEEFGGAVGPAMLLAEIYSTQGQQRKAKVTFDSAVNELENASNGLLANILDQSRAIGSYIVGSPEAASHFEKLGMHPNTALGWAELAPLKGNMNFKPHDERKMMMLPLVLMLRFPAQEELWWKRAIEQMEHLGDGVAPVTDILKGKFSTEETIAKLKSGLLEPTDAAVLLTALAKRTKSMDARMKYRALAKTYNVRRGAPYRLLKRTLDKLD